MNGPTIFLSSEIEVGVRYLFYSDIARSLIDDGASVVCLVPDLLAPDLREMLGGLGAALSQVQVQELCMPPERASAASRLVNKALSHLRMTGMSRRLNTSVIDDINSFQLKGWATPRRRMALPVLRAARWAMQRSATARRLLEGVRARRPLVGLHAELFDRYRPDLVVTTSPGWWPAEEQLLREAKARGIPTAAVISGWDHTSSKGLPGAKPDYIFAWSECQRRELIDGSDLDGRKIELLGVAHFDRYVNAGLAEARDHFFTDRGLDPTRALIVFGCSFVGMSSNVGIVRTLAEAVAGDRFGRPVQLVVRLHPSHLNPYTEITREIGEYEGLSREFEHVHLDYPVPVSRDLHGTRGPEHAAGLVSLLRHADVFVTLFSTTVLEAAIAGVPIVTVAIDPPEQWRWTHTVPITSALKWPTHERILRSDATVVAFTSEELLGGVDHALRDRDLKAAERRKFVEQECSFTDGASGRRIAGRLLQLAAQACAPEPSQS